MPWPETCRFFDPNTMSQARLLTFLNQDTEYDNQYVAWHVSSLVMHQGSCISRTEAETSESTSNILGLKSPPGSTTFIYLKHKRLWFQQETKYAVGVSRDAWMRILERYEIPLSVVELIYNNNGGNLAQVTSDGATGSAFHVAYKIGGWGDHECMAYARHELHSGNSFVLVAGLVPRCLDKLQSLFERAPQSNIFHAMLELASSELDVVEKMRFSWDFDVLELEAKTGFSSFQISGIKPLTVEQLANYKEGYVTLDGLRDVGWGSELVVTTCRALLDHLSKYAELCDGVSGESGDCQPNQVVDVLRAVFLQKLSTAEMQRSQIRQLRLRVMAQLELIRSLITQRDMQLNIEIASAAKQDSEAMKGIAFVTMVFLPATSVATFLSMSIFSTAETEQVLIPGVWVFAAVTLPLTVLIATWYFAATSAWLVKVLSERKAHSEESLEDTAVINTRAAFVARQALRERLPSHVRRPDENPNQYGWTAYDSG